MMLLAATKTEQLARLLGIEPQTLETVLWGVLVGGLAFSMLHLLTMLVTRWGDTGATTKSLIFSVLIHLSCAFGLLMWKFPPPAIQAAQEEPPPPVFVQGPEAEEKVETAEPGNTPVFRKLSEPAKVEITRSDWVPTTPEPLAEANRQEQQSEPHRLPAADLPDYPNLPEMPPVTAEVTREGQVGPQRVAQTPLNIDEPTAEKQPEMQLPASIPERARLIRDGETDLPVRRESRPKTIDRIEPEVDTQERLVAPELRVSARSSLHRASEASEIIRRRSGPVPSPQPAEEAGVAGEADQEQTTGSTPSPPRLTRRSTETVLSRTEGSLERFRADRTPQTPSPRTPRPAAVRTVPAAPVPRPGPRPNVPRRDGALVRVPHSVHFPETYRSRDPQRQIEALQKYGGTQESQRAVDLGLKWLALHQQAEGYWDADRFGSGQVRFDEQGVDRQNAGKYSDAGVTGLALLAFLAKSYTHEEGMYSSQVERALRWLIRRQEADGYLGADAVHHARMYCHAMATFALAEAYGMETQPLPDLDLKRPLQKAVDYILENQNADDGGWRYIKGQKGDMSMFGWQLMAMNRAKTAGIRIPREAEIRMVQFLKDNSRGTHGGLAGYQADYPVSPAMTAESLFCKQVFRIPRDDPASREAVEYLMQNLPKHSETNLYYWYYATLALFNYHGEEWREWNKAMESTLIAQQRKEGDEAGSWDPIGPWGRYGGRVYSTALSALCLEVYFRDPPRYGDDEQAATIRGSR